MLKSLLKTKLPKPGWILHFLIHNESSALDFKGCRSLVEITCEH